MCTLAIYVRCTGALPLLVAANRDEFYSRPARPPELLSHDPWVVGGRDLNAGGTWLGTNEMGVVVGVLNRRNPRGPDPTKRSRGLLCLEVLQSGGIDDVLRYMDTQYPEHYNWFSLVVADVHRAFVVCNAEGRFHVVELNPGVHVVTNFDVDDLSCPRLAWSQPRFKSLELPSFPAEAPALVARLREILSDHSRPPDARDDVTASLCIHSPGYGTCSSSILAQFAEEERIRYWHAVGPPCKAVFEEIPLPDRGPCAGQKVPE